MNETTTTTVLNTVKKWDARDANFSSAQLQHKRPSARRTGLFAEHLEQQQPTGFEPTSTVHPFPAP
ncbi:hypothetical protein M5W90_03385 [Paenibacillus thiaminolyticus]|uniref:hypothetical protein n=1 Tax=Paenibacillus thiaminolyticus TaxID=49283 RepID=UPI000FD9989F|nr:hypothetical protein [Paenibacillus thiaminolyticus]MCY9536246.1 hypothetical protein [Paenibacillus thiaminolyticus]MCY9611876.1 hypothetical protein [Paenibacillus thiaminolyticus]MCY9654787.1 hypothetical protein [Paenibacillus thiaminolyticus]